MLEINNFNNNNNDIWNPFCTFYMSYTELKMRTTTIAFGWKIIMEMPPTPFLFTMDITFQQWTETMMKLHLAVLVRHHMGVVGGFTGEIT